MGEIKTILSRAVLRILRPLVHILLRNEMSHSEFSELARRAYVETAFKHFGLPNRKNTVSRVSVLTGLSRKEVVRLAAITPDQAATTNKPVNRASQVVIGWLRDPEFLGTDNRPKELPLHGETGSFDGLVKKYSGSITPRAVLDELIRVGAVSRLDKQTVKLNHYGYLPESSGTEMIDVLSTHTADLLSTGNFNLSRDKREPAHFQRQVTYIDIPESLAMESQAYCHEKLTTLIIEVNQWLASHKSTLDDSHEEPTFRVGVGAYFVKHKMPEED